MIFKEVPDRLDRQESDISVDQDALKSHFEWDVMNAPYDISYKVD